jgi:hypothetical protein
LAALCCIVFVAEVCAAALLPGEGWIPRLQIVLAITYGLGIYCLARHRIPVATRQGQSIFKLTAYCICANHFRCSDHLTCPCGCHDNHIKRMMAWPAPNPATIGMRNGQGVSRSQ